MPTQYKSGGKEHWELVKRVKGHDKQFQEMTQLFNLVVVVLLVMVATMVISVLAIVISFFQNQAEASRELANQIESARRDLPIFLRNVKSQK